MPARSRKQQMTAGAALAAKRNEAPRSKLKGASRKMADTMTEKQLSDLAATPRKSLSRKRGATGGSAAASGKAAAATRSGGSRSGKSASKSSPSRARSARSNAP